MTCKDCIHERVCYALIKDGLPYLDNDKLPAEAFCMEFKNKSDVNEIIYAEWKPTNTPSYFGGIIYECSHCEAKDGEHSKVLGTYCWRCGAKMRKDN